jgi:hypothetical protein
MKWGVSQVSQAHGLMGLSDSQERRRLVWAFIRHAPALDRRVRNALERLRLLFSLGRIKRRLSSECIVIGRLGRCFHLPIPLRRG